MTAGYHNFANGRSVLNPTLRRHLGVIFPTTFVLHVFASHFGSSHKMSNFCVCICYGDLQSVMFDVAIIIVLKLHELWRYMIADLIDKCCVCSDCSATLFPSLYLSLGLLVAWDKTMLKLGQVNPTKTSSERKCFTYLTLNQKAKNDYTKVRKTCWKAKTGAKARSLCQRVSQSGECKEKCWKELKSPIRVNTWIIGNWNRLITDMGKVAVIQEKGGNPAGT